MVSPGAPPKQSFVWELKPPPPFPSAARVPLRPLNLSHYQNSGSALAKQILNQGHATQRSRRPGPSRTQQNSLADQETHKLSLWGSYQGKSSHEIPSPHKCPSRVLHPRHVLLLRPPHPPLPTAFNTSVLVHSHFSRHSRDGHHHIRPGRALTPRFSIGIVIKH